MKEFHGKSEGTDSFDADGDIDEYIGGVAGDDEERCR